MGEEPAALGKGLTGDDLPDAKGKYLGRMVLAEGDISPCKHRIHHVIEAMPRITYVTLLVNALFWSTLWSTH